MANAGTATLDFGSAGDSTMSVLVTGQTGILSNSLVEAWILPATTSNHSPDEHIIEELYVFAGNVVAGQGFTIYGKSGNVEIFGQWNIGWVWN